MSGANKHVHSSVQQWEKKSGGVFCSCVFWHQTRQLQGLFFILKSNSSHPVDP